MVASRNNNTEIVKLLIESGCDLNLTSEPKGMSALHFAASKGNVEIMKLLIEAGCDKMNLSEDGKMAADFLIENDSQHNATIVDELLLLLKSQ